MDISNEAAIILNTYLLTTINLCDLSIVECFNRSLTDCKTVLIAYEIFVGNPLYC